MDYDKQDVGPLTSFHLFPLLPFDIRAVIWGLAATPRTIHLTYDRDEPETAGGEEPAPVVGLGDFDDGPPPVVQACVDARRFAPYSKFYVAEDSEDYVWANFELDTVRMTCMDLPYCGPLKEHVRHLDLIHGGDSGGYFLDEWWRQRFAPFTALEDVEISDYEFDLGDWIGRPAHMGLRIPLREFTIYDLLAEREYNGEELMAEQEYSGEEL